MSEEQLARRTMAAIDERMKAMGMSGNALAKATGIQQTSIAGWLREPGTSGPRLNDLQKIARALATTPEKLIRGIAR